MASGLSPPLLPVAAGSWGQGEGGLLTSCHQLILPQAGSKGLSGQEGQPRFCVVRPHGMCCTIHCLLRSVQGERIAVTARVINTEWDRCDCWVGAGLCDPVSQYVVQSLKTFEGKQNATLIPALGLLGLLITVVPAVKGSSLALLPRGRAGPDAFPTWKGSPLWRGSERLQLAEWVRCAGSCRRWNPWRPPDWPAPSWRERRGMGTKRA